MKRFYKEVFKSKKPSLGPIRGPGLANSTSTLITSAADLRPSVPASSCASDKVVLKSPADVLNKVNNNWSARPLFNGG
jgi:hypothetical protein